jgi:hypothetical protein
MFTAVFGSDDRTSGTSHDFRIRLNPPMRLNPGTGNPPKWKIALADLALWYTLYNVSDDYNNRQFVYSPNNGVTWKTVQLTAGIYNASALAAAISSAVTANGDNAANLLISANVNTQKFIFTFDNNYQVDFTGLEIRTIFGAESAIYSVSGPMPNVAKMTNEVNSWYLHTDLIEYGQSGALQGRVLHSFNPQVSPGSAIREVPQHAYVAVKSVDFINEVHFWITDQKDRPLNLNGEPVSVRLHFVKD